VKNYGSIGKLSSSFSAFSDMAPVTPLAAPLSHSAYLPLARRFINSA
jgi:hypothetical protein